MASDEREYVRDKRSPTPTNENISRVMSANKRKDTSPELILRRMLRENGFPGYRLQYDVPGKPDISYPSRKVAIFVNGCYWHRCPRCDLPLPKNNTEFWKNKFRKNAERDTRKVEELHEQGWTVITVWECDLNKRMDETLRQILQILES